MMGTAAAVRVFYAPEAVKGPGTADCKPGGLPEKFSQ
jgi:hypothetical protein